LYGLHDRTSDFAFVKGGVFLSLDGLERLGERRLNEPASGLQGAIARAKDPARLFGADLLPRQRSIPT